MLMKEIEGVTNERREGIKQRVSRRMVFKVIDLAQLFLLRDYFLEQ